MTPSEELRALLERATERPWLEMGAGAGDLFVADAAWQVIAKVPVKGHTSSSTEIANREVIVWLVNHAEAIAELIEAAEVWAARPCDASEFYSIPEDGISRCLDPEFNDMTEWPEGKPLERCDACASRAALDKLRQEEK